MQSRTEKPTDKAPGSAEAAGTPETELSRDPVQNGGSIGELRRLLIGSDEISSVLPEAVSKSSKQSTDLSDATLPLVEQNIRESVIRNPKILADALFPVIGPAIRKAIAAALSSMVQSFNQTLEHSVSPKGLRWRLEAMRTGRSFGEVVMLKTLLYRVEQVFLIHRETGLLLQHVAQNPQDTEDADMVSAMLTAITDFAHDSFKTAEDATLDSLKISGLSVWIEGSPDALLAAVIRGNPPLELRETFSLAIEKIQFSFERELDNFSGDSDVFFPSRPVLEECLQFQTGEERQQSGLLSPANLILGFLGLALVVILGYFGWDYWRWTGLLEDVRNEPGYILTDYDRGWFTHSVAGLRDPLSETPSRFLSENSYDEDDVRFTWRDYQDSGSRFALERARRLLRPPDGVKLTLKDGELLISGTVSPEWRAEAERLGPFVAGVNSIAFAPDAGLISSIEKSKLLFKCGTAEVQSKEALERAAAEFRKLTEIGSFKVDVIGHADQTGTPDFNDSISKKRAAVVGEAIRSGIADDPLSDKVRLNERSAAAVSDECKVTFKVTPLNQ